MAEMIEYINKLTVTERLQVMELLWNSLCVPQYESPAWHEGVLKERERRVAEGCNGWVLRCWLVCGRS